MTVERLTRAVAQVPAVPDDLEDVDFEKVSGVVELPVHIRWSGSPRCYDLADRQQRARVYEQVLREGNKDDVRRLIRLMMSSACGMNWCFPGMYAGRGPTG